MTETESSDNWASFLQNLCRLIGHHEGLVIHTDACKGLETTVEQVWPGVEHREYMRHLVANFGKKNPRARSMMIIFFPQA